MNACFPVLSMLGSHLGMWTRNTVGLLLEAKLEMGCEHPLAALFHYRFKSASYASSILSILCSRGIGFRAFFVGLPLHARRLVFL